MQPTLDSALGRSEHIEGFCLHKLLVAQIIVYYYILYIGDNTCWEYNKERGIGERGRREWKEWRKGRGQKEWMLVGCVTQRVDWELQ